MSAPGRVRLCTPQDEAAIYAIVNDAATAYKGHIPADCYHEPYMPIAELSEEMHRITFWGWEEAGKLLGIMGLETVQDVTLIRHAYVLTAHQRKSIPTCRDSWYISLPGRPRRGCWWAHGPRPSGPAPFIENTVFAPFPTRMNFC